MFMNSGKLNILILVDLSVKLPSILVSRRMLCAFAITDIFYLLVSVKFTAVAICWVAAVAVYHGVGCLHQSGDVTQHHVTH